jgi:transposase
MQRNEISFKGQKIFIGIDVHKNKWSVTCITDYGFCCTYTQKASATDLSTYLNRHFPDGEYHAVYEAGFTGFSTYYALSECGINCIVIHAADVPSTQYDAVMKTDKVDSVKLAKSLRAGLLHGIYIREVENLDDRGVVRLRATIRKEVARYKVRAKHLLMTNGVELPEESQHNGGRWTNNLINWMRNDVKLLSSTRISLDMLLDQVMSSRKALLSATKRLRELAKSDKYKSRFDLLMSIPGIGHIVAMTILTEIYDINRFSNERQFAHYLGLIPTSHSSGDKVVHGEKTFRGNKELGPMIVEAAWIAVRKDIGLASAFGSYCKRMKPNNAITHIARKLSNIIFSVLKNEKAYVPYLFG